MVYEHQRADRDKYIQVLYKNVRDYDQCLQKASIKEPGITGDQPCLDYRKTTQHGCGCGAYIKGVNPEGLEIKAGSRFDYKSIMMYSSFNGAKKSCVERFDNCSLARWIYPEDHSKGTMPVQLLRAISYMD